MSVPSVDRIKATSYFENLDSVQKIIYGKVKTVKEVQHNYLLAKNLGVEEWLRVKSPTRHVKGLVSDLLEEDDSTGSK